MREKDYNPLALLGGLIIITICLLARVDIISAALSLGITVAIGIINKVEWKMVVRRLAPLSIAIPVTGASMLLYAQPEGRIYWSWSIMTISSNSIYLACAVMLRIIALTLPIIILAPRIDVTRVGDACGQILRVPRQFVVGTVAGLRMLSLMERDWGHINRARRMRGVGDSPLIMRLGSQAFFLLVISLRRTQKLALAIQARGLQEKREKYTWARTSSMHKRDYIFLVLCLAWGLIPLIASFII